jgi:hypothetical protein
MIKHQTYNLSILRPALRSRLEDNYFFYIHYDHRHILTLHTHLPRKAKLIQTDIA